MKLVLWIESKGYIVIEECRSADYILFEDKEIFINSQYKWENKLYTLLHECGHYLLNETKDTFLEMYPVYPPAIVDKRVVNSLAYKVSILSLELKAWERGWRLAKRLNLIIDQKNYHKSMVEALWTYVLDVTKGTQ